MIVNAYARDLGWLMADLLRHFGRAGAVVSDAPLPEADAWIAIRTDEAKLSPDPSRTVAQIHDMWDHELPFGIGAVVRTHPDQARHYRTPPGRDLNTQPIPGFCRPIGALECFTLRDQLSDRFTVGWVGRPRGGRSPRSPAMLIDALTYLPDALRREVVVLLVGEGLESAEARLRELGIAVEYHHRRDTPIESYPALYHRMDCLVITSTEEAGPMCLFEAIASGVYVLSTPAGWAKVWGKRHAIGGRDGVCSLYSHDVDVAQLAHPAFDDAGSARPPGSSRTVANLDLATLLEDVDACRGELFATREHRQRGHWTIHGRWSLESWVELNLNLARSLAR